jgi:hypothetical protein
MFPSRAFRFTQSVRKSASSSGQLELLTTAESTSLAEYEAVIENYKEAREINTIWKDSNREMFYYLSIFKQNVNRNLERRLPNVTILNHPDYELSDQEFISYLKDKEIYAKLNDIFISSLVDVTWLESIILDIDNTIEVLR